MANVNKVIFVGRLTRDPEMRTFSNGGKVAKFGFAVTNRRKNAQTGEWEDEPMFIDCEAFNRGETGKLADTIERFLHKGSQAYLEGRLHLDQWDDKTTGAKRSKHKLVVEVMQLLDGRPADGEGGARPAARPAAARGNGTARSAPAYESYDEPDEGHSGRNEGNAEDIPF